MEAGGHRVFPWRVRPIVPQRLAKFLMPRQYRNRKRPSKTKTRRAKLLWWVAGSAVLVTSMETVKEAQAMDIRAVHAPARLTLRAGAVVAAILAIGIAASSALAQTLTQPNPPARWTPPRRAAKSQPAAHGKSCDAFGAGFVALPGSDACVKIGGWVSVDGTGRAR
jgi:hypothetical protein